MGRIVGYIIFGLFSLLSLCVGIASLIDGFTGIGDVTSVSGKLEIVAPATDNALGLTDMGPVIFREAEMYQYVIEKTSETVDGDTKDFRYLGEAFEKEPMGEFKTYPTLRDAKSLFGKEKKYVNPEFPPEFLNINNYGSSVIAGDVEIDGVRLDVSILRLFNGEGFGMEDSTVAAYKTPENAGAAYGLKYLGDGVYASKDTENWEVGDLRVSYRVADPEILAREYTAVGVLNEDGVLCCDEEYGALYDSVVSMDEINHDFKSKQLKDGVLFILLAIGLAVGGFFITNFLCDG